MCGVASLATFPKLLPNGQSFPELGGVCVKIDNNCNKIVIFALLRKKK